MRITIVAVGSRGDVQPYIALGKGLHRAGHDVRVMTHDDFEPLVNAHALEYWPARGNVQQAVESDVMRSRVERGNFIAIARGVGQFAKEAALAWAKDGLAACAGADLVVTGIGGQFNALGLAEKLDLPLLRAYLWPATPTRAFPGVLVPGWLERLGGLVTRQSHHLPGQALWQSFRAADKMARQQVLGLPPAPFFGPFNSPRLRALPLLYGYSPTLIPKPPDWGSDVHVTGYWFLEEPAAWTPPPDLLAFLEAGPPPVYIGFGSMSSRKPEETTALVLQALEQTGQRAVLLTGWGGLKQTDVPESVLMVDSVPHAWLFPRMAAVVHHGAAGTTAAGLRAGVPSILTPFFGDQPFWGRQVAALGVGPAPIPRKKLSAGLLAAAIRQAVNDQPMRQRAAEVGAAIRAEDGVARAVAVIGDLNLGRG